MLNVWQLTIGFVLVLVVVLGGGMFAPGPRYTLRGTVKVATGDRIGRGVGVEIHGGIDCAWACLKCGSILFLLRLCGSVVEHLSCKQKVPSSILGGGIAFAGW